MFQMEIEDLGAAIKLEIQKIPILNINIQRVEMEENLIVLMWILMICMILFFISAIILTFCLIRNVYHGKALFQTISTSNQ